MGVNDAFDRSGLPLTGMSTLGRAAAAVVSVWVLHIAYA